MMEWPRHIPTLTDGVITLRALEPDDVDAVLHTASDPDSIAFTTVPDPYTRQDAVDFVETHSTKVWPGFEVAIADADDALVGTCGLRIRDDESAVTEIGYMVAPWARGRGIATRATRLLIDYSWTIGAYRVALDASTINPASRRVALRCGMTEEGILRSAHLGNGGIRHDVVVYGILRTDPRT
ncbi:GNAT family N-acetyltransferase [Williamsia phyllosphaerae]|uniref:N-acetyltransferase n=1 Tax=Williamsia phyllosphaerae TaxID=885042 RepID=A0ABQ1U4F2_9NOCA|nr:GNAT family protein [Williamsia phyllosphaerae]GGF10308.1 N-acetyltransferase [Williamsia phyllosphaerae]